MMRIISWSLLICFSVNAWAADKSSLAFKPEATAMSIPWSMIVILTVALTGLIFYWFKVKNPTVNTQNKLTIIEQKRLNNKTSLYVIEIENQSILLVDNGQHITTHCLNPKSQLLHKASVLPEKNQDEN